MNRSKIAALLLMGTAIIFNSHAQAQAAASRHTPAPTRPHNIPAPHIVSYKGYAQPGDIVINKQTRRLYYIEARDKAVEYVIGVGKEETASPEGTFAISRKVKNPDWIPTASMVKRHSKLKPVAGGHPANPLGVRALYLGNTLYRIHGTIYPASVGKAQSHGCFRMLNADVRDLYARVEENAAVTIINQSTTPGVGRPETSGLQFAVH